MDLVFDVIGGEIGKRSARLIRPGGTLVSIVGPVEARPVDGVAIDFVVEADRDASAFFYQVPVSVPTQFRSRIVSCRA